MRPWMIWILIFLVLALCRVGIHVIYRDNKLLLWVVVSKMRIILIGKEKKKRKNRAKSVKKTSVPQTTVSTNSHLKKKKNQGAAKLWFQVVLDEWNGIVSVIGRVLTKPTLDVFRLCIAVGAGDAESCAMTYGRICAIVGGCLPAFEKTFRIKKREINVYCCFERDKLEFDAETVITLRIYEVFALVFALLGLGIRLFLKVRNMKKAV